MRVGLVTDFYYPWIGGPSILLRNLGHGLAARGHAVMLLAPSPTGRRLVEGDGPMEVTRAATISSPFGYGLRVAPPFSPDVGAWLDRTHPEVVHVHHPFPLSAGAIFAAKRRRIPVVATNHTIPECTLWGIRRSVPMYAAASWTFGAWIAFLMRKCDDVATPTDTAASALRALGFAGTIRAISNGVDIERFSPGPPDAEVRARLGFDERPIVLYTGRLDAEKQMDVWLRAAAEVARRVDAQFAVGGKGTDRNRLEALSFELGLTDRLRFFGYVEEEYLSALYRLASVYLITSPVELQSISTLEAVASGLPVVAVRAGALPELVRPEFNGRLVESGDAMGAAQAVVRVLSEPSISSQFARNSRTLAERHDLDLTIAAYEGFLRDAACTGQGERQIEQPAAARS